MKPNRRNLFAALSIGVSILAVLLGLELVLRFFPVSEGLRGLPVNDENPVYRFAPNRTLRWSKGWNFTLVNEVRTNNYGFISNRDYDPAARSPLLAVIGDSFVEAAMVPYGRTAAGILGRVVGDDGRIYSFGSSGSALSQYLAYARYARDEFHPDGMVVIIAGNDFDESLLKYRSVPGFHYFVEQEDGRLTLQCIDRTIPWWKDLLVIPTLGRYIVMNLEVGNVVDRFKRRISSFLGRGPQFVGNVDAITEPGRVRDSERAVDEFLLRLPEMSGLPDGKLALILDAPRPEIYWLEDLQAVQNSYFEVMRRYLMRAASTNGFEVIDLEPVFRADYQRRGMKFEHPHDYHWNATGHEVVAQAIQQSRVFREILGGDSSAGTARSRAGGLPSR